MERLFLRFREKKRRNVKTNKVVTNAKLTESHGKMISNGNKQALCEPNSAAFA